MTLLRSPLAALVCALALGPAAGQDVNEAYEKAMKEAAKAVAPSVVKIETAGGREVLGGGQGPGIRKGVGPIFVDTGQGIPDIELALREGYTTGGGLGLGLGGSKRLVDEFDIDSRAGEGTAVSVVKWKR